VSSVSGKLSKQSFVIIWLGVVAAVLASPARAQEGPEKGGHEVQLWTGGGTSRSGGVRDIGVWNAGFRYGWILTEGHGPSILHGRFEYALDTTPIFWFFQPGGTAFGAGLSPVVLKWNFDAGGRVVPYVEANAGFVFTSRAVPPGAGHFNFTSSGAVGAHFLRDRGNLSAEVRFMHISNAGLTTYNPGINTIQVRIGLGRFFGSN
jgi:Lipid A 3-O-deacylase (PagL)